MRWLFVLQLWIGCFACYNCQVLEEIVAPDCKRVEIPDALKKKRIVLHLDVNGVLVGFDSNHRGGVHEYMIYQLSKLLVDDWGSGPMSYYDWVNQQVKIGAPREDTTRLLRSRIAYTEYASAYDRAFEKLKAASEKSMIFEAFFELIESLEGCDFRISLRSFGSELERVGRAIEERCGLHFKRVEVVGDTWVLEGEQKFSEVSEIHLLCANNHLLVHDDYRHWRRGGRASTSGKIFPISSSEEFVELFFDDNAVWGDDARASAVNPRNLDGTPIPFKNEINKHIIHVKTAQVICNKNYFIDNLKLQH